MLGAKKAPKLGAKKVATADVIDFDEAERKAREEAERIEKLGYDPEAEQAEADAKARTAAASSTTTITSPTPISPSRAGLGAAGKSHERSSSEVERLGMGMGRLGFGQVSRPAAAPKKPGFGAVGPSKSPADGMLPSLFRVTHNLTIVIEEELAQAKSRFGTQKGISSDEFFGRDRFDSNTQAEAKERLRQFDGAASISSNSYFGRPEDDLPPMDDGYGDLETAAKDFVRRFGITAGDDLENLSHIVGEGATKLQSELTIQSTSFFSMILIVGTTGAIRSYLNS